jgi:hypothetical protein
MKMSIRKTMMASRTAVPANRRTRKFTTSELFVGLDLAVQRIEMSAATPKRNATTAVLHKITSLSLLQPLSFLQKKAQRFGTRESVHQIHLHNQSQRLQAMDRISRRGLQVPELSPCSRSLHRQIYHPLMIRRTSLLPLSRGQSLLRLC